MNETPTPETLTDMYSQAGKLYQLLELIERTETQMTTTSGADFYAEVIALRESLKEKINREIANKL